MSLYAYNISWVITPLGNTTKEFDLHVLPRVVVASAPDKHPCGTVGKQNEFFGGSFRLWGCRGLSGAIGSYGGQMCEMLSLFTVIKRRRAE